MILDSDTVNAVAVGRTVEDAVIVLPRRVLKDKGRAPAEATVGELISTILNGDLRIALPSLLARRALLRRRGR